MRVFYCRNRVVLKRQLPVIRANTDFSCLLLVEAKNRQISILMWSEVVEFKCGSGLGGKRVKGECKPGHSLLA